MTLTFYLGIVITGIDQMFRHFLGLYSVFSFNMLTFLYLSFAAIIALRVINNAGSSLSRSIDTPRMMYDRIETRIHSDHSKDIKEDKSKE